MKRSALLPLAALFMCGTLLALTFNSTLFTSGPPEAPAQTAAPDRAPARAPDAPPLDLLQIQRPAALQADSVGSAELLYRLGQLYRLQSEILTAEAEGDAAQAGQLIDRAMGELSALTERPGATENPRFQQVFHSLTAEYRTYYGAPDTLALPAGTIYDTRRGLFAALDQRDAPQLEEAMPEAGQPQATSIPLPVNSYTEPTLTYLRRSAGRNFYRWMQRKETYFPMFEHVLSEEGVPDELKYLAVIESGLNPRARSHAGAAGLWQFMPATGRAYGLEINAYVDERLDPEKATRAAARHLRDLYQLFGDWQLALAGYNCNPAVIRRAVRRAGRGATFWDITHAIPSETRNYVPTFIATALAMSNPAQYNLRRVAPGPQYTFDQVPVRSMISLETAAELAGTDVKTLRALNPELRKATLPPSAEPYMLRLPYGTYERFTAAYGALPDSKKNLTLTHRVRPGESLGGIAGRYDVPLDAVQRLNDLSGTTIRAGQALVIPTSAEAAQGDVQLASLEDEAMPMRVRYTPRAARALAAKGEATKKAPGHQIRIHRVRSGDSLYTIARRYDVSVKQLRQWNDLRGTGLQIGQQLKVLS